MERRPATVADALAEFLDDLLLSNRSPRTIRTYRVLLRFPDMQLLDFDRAFCRAWLMTQLRQRKPSGAKTCKGALSSFCSWLVGRGWLAVNPCDGLGRIRVPQSPPRALSEAQMAALWRAAEELDADAAPKDGIVIVSTHGGSTTRLTGHSLPPPETCHGQGALNGSSQRQSITNRLLLSPQAAEELDSEAASPANMQEGDLDVSGNAAVACWPSKRRPDSDEPPDERFSHDGRPSVNNRLLLSLLSAGLRRSEVAGLRWQDMDFERRTMRVLGKGSKVRTVLIPRAAMELICAGRASEMQSSSSLTVIDRPASPAPAQSHPTTGSVFGGNVQQSVQATANLNREANVQRFGSVFGVSDERIYQRFKLIARRAGVACTPHQLRHTFATNYLRKGGSPLYLQQLGGWSGSEMVARYSRAALADAAIEEARRLEQ